MSHEAICPCNLQCNFCQKKYCRFQLGCQTYATCFATCNEILFYPRRVFKNASCILILSYCDWFLPKKKTTKFSLRDKLQTLGCHTRKSCNLQCNAISVATCKENCLVWHDLKPSVSRVETSVKFVMSWITCMYILRLFSSDPFFYVRLRSMLNTRQWTSLRVLSTPYVYV